MRSGRRRRSRQQSVFCNELVGFHCRPLHHVYSINTTLYRSNFSPSSASGIAKAKRAEGEREGESWTSGQGTEGL
jgi:hypothetical protein